MSGVAARQLALDLRHEESFAREDFLVGPANAAALATVERWPDWPARALALIGPEGSGKSHLAAIWAERAGARFLSARVLGETNLAAALATGALVLEDVASSNFDQRALFHLLNLAREHSSYVLMTASSTPAAWPIGLLDLASRLRAIPTVALEPPDDALLRGVLVKLFADRQLEVDESLIAFLIARIGRSLSDAREAVARLDGEALRQGRAVTRALASEILRET
jgi:chromosomal replication initiation ATPase DnaA